MQTINEMSTIELKQRLAKHDNVFLLDVREPKEVEICDIKGAKHIPINLIPLYLDQVPDDIDIIIYCHHGVRSLNVAYYLAENGFDHERLFNLTGGIDAWALTIESEMVRY